MPGWWVGNNCTWNACLSRFYYGPFVRSGSNNFF
jgi:hypothetical protein